VKRRERTRDGGKNGRVGEIMGSRKEEEGEIRVKKWRMGREGEKRDGERDREREG